MRFAGRLGVALTVLVTARAGAQAGAGSSPEARVDVFAATHSQSLQGAVGWTIPLDVYTRTTIIAGAGVATNDTTQWVAGRVDVITRFLFDPFHQETRGISLGGGLSVNNTIRNRWRPYLVGVVDVEFGAFPGRDRSALQVGIGDGIRVGLVYRFNRAGWR